MRPVREGLFTDEPRLLGSRCRDCGKHHFPSAPACPYCGGGSDEVALSPTGTLWAWTAVTASPPGYEGDRPFGFGVVELPEGVRVITRLTVADPSGLAFGEPVRMELVPLHDDVVTYAFGPA